MSRNAERLRRLVDDLLFVARADTGEFALERKPVELAPVAEEAIVTWQDRAAAAGVTLATLDAASPVVLADRDRLLQLLDNLVENAIKFTPPGGSVEVRVGAGAHGATLAVADTGLGIPVEDRDRVFERVYRGSRAVGGAVPGAGLGLAIVGEIVAAHAGSIGLVSEIDRGTTLTVTLPLAS